MDTDNSRRMEVPSSKYWTSEIGVDDRSVGGYSQGLVEPYHDEVIFLFHSNVYQLPDCIKDDISYG